MEQLISAASLETIIAKVKQLKELTPEEELIYLVYFEKVPMEEAKAMINDWYKSS